MSENQEKESEYLTKQDGRSFGDWYATLQLLVLRLKEPLPDELHPSEDVLQAYYNEDYGPARIIAFIVAARRDGHTLDKRWCY